LRLASTSKPIMALCANSGRLQCIVFVCTLGCVTIKMRVNAELLL